MAVYSSVQSTPVLWCQVRMVPGTWLPGTYSSMLCTSAPSAVDLSAVDRPRVGPLPRSLGPAVAGSVYRYHLSEE